MRFTSRVHHSGRDEIFSAAAPTRVRKASPGPLFRVADPAWLRWNDGTVEKLARTIYDERRFDRMPILADALEEAGWDHADILAHCRGPNDPVRGCWVVDLMLGKA